MDGQGGQKGLATVETNANFGREDERWDERDEERGARLEEKEARRAAWIAEVFQPVACARTDAERPVRGCESGGRRSSRCPGRHRRVRLTDKLIRSRPLGLLSIG